MKTHILELILDPAVRKRSAIHDCFLDDLEKMGLRRDYSKLAHAKNIPLALYRNTCPGYYGRKGTIIIHSMLLRMLGVANLPGHTIAPLGLSRFTECFLAHVVAAHLIAQDLGCDIKLGYQMMLTSGAAGDVLHPYEADEEDDEIDAV
ncbi:hypothetical protein HD554DRAFT_1980145, partial [Boletus coccyginus]